jgi:hypothetical protein
VQHEKCKFTNPGLIHPFVPGMHQGRPKCKIFGQAFKEYERLKKLEDMYWGERALEAEAEGYIGEEERR